VCSSDLGCGTLHMAAKKDPETGLLEASKELPPESILISQSILIDKYLQFAILRPSGSTTQTNVEDQINYLRDAIANLERFGEAYLVADCERKVISDGNADKISDVYGLLGLRRVEKIYGPFMVINIHDEFGGVEATTTLEAIDPASGETLFKLKHRSVNHMVGVRDQEHYNPILNAFDEWIAQNMSNAQ